MNAVESIKRHEGFRKRMYTDSVGVATIGYGFNLEQIELPKPVAELWLSIEIEKHEKQLESMEWYQYLDPERQAVLLNMHYNLGHSRFKKFKKMIAAVIIGDYGQAAEEMLDSLWAQQVGERAIELAEIMRGNR